MGELLTPTHLVVIAAIALVLFGGKKLPELGKGLGEGFRGFRDGIRGLTGEANNLGAHVPPPSVAKPDGRAQ
jgi:sec-independent protein translocase protein TatA